MTLDNVSRLTPPLLALQFAALGWRINREISVGDSGRRTWFPLPDILNVVSMFAVVICLILLPLATDDFARLSRIVLGVGYLLLAFHPITMTAHYRLFSRRGRAVYKDKGRDYPYATGQEIVTFIVSLLLAAGVAVTLKQFN